MFYQRPYLQKVNHYTTLFSIFKTLWKKLMLCFITQSEFTKNFCHRRRSFHVENVPLTARYQKPSDAHLRSEPRLVRWLTVTTNEGGFFFQTNFSIFPSFRSSSYVTGFFALPYGMRCLWIFSASCQLRHDSVKRFFYLRKTASQKRHHIYCKWCYIFFRAEDFIFLQGKSLP